MSTIKVPCISDCFTIQTSPADYNRNNTGTMNYYSFGKKEYKYGSIDITDVYACYLQFRIPAEALTKKITGIVLNQKIISAPVSYMSCQYVNVKNVSDYIIEHKLTFDNTGDYIDGKSEIRVIATSSASVFNIFKNDYVQEDIITLKGTGTVFQEYGDLQSRHVNSGEFPYLNITYDDGQAPPTATNITNLTEEQKNTKLNIKIQWQFDKNTGVIKDNHIRSEIVVTQAGSNRFAITIEGTATEYTMLGGTMQHATNPVTIAVRVQSQNNGWSSYAEYIFTPKTSKPGLTISDLAADEKNILREIPLKWAYAKNTSISYTDPQVRAEITVSQTGSTTIVRTSEGSGNTYKLSAGSLKNTNNVNVKIRVESQYNGWSDYANYIFTPIYLPPQAPVNFRPDTNQNPGYDFEISWQHNKNQYVSYQDPQTGVIIEFSQAGIQPVTVRLDNTNQSKYTVPGNTFKFIGSGTVKIKTISQYNGEGAWGVFTIPLAHTPPLPPTNLSPTQNQNPKIDIILSWQYVKNPITKDDVQIGAEVEYWIEGGTKRSKYITGEINTALIPANTFVEYKKVYFRARVETLKNGLGEWSTNEFFQLSQTPPFAPLLKFPINILIRADIDTILSWRYASSLSASDFQGGFTIEWIKNGILQAAITQESTTNSFQLPAIMDTATIEWRVKTANSVGEWGAFSEWGSFNTVGRPNPPNITKHINANRTTIFFTTDKDLSFSVQLFKSGEQIWEADRQPYEAAGEYIIPLWLENGAYSVRIKTISSLDFESDWVNYNFVINTVWTDFIPKLTISSNQKYYVDLHFKVSGEKCLIYRDGEIIASTKTDNYKDYTALSNVHHLYSVRAIAGDNYVDSNTAGGLCRFFALSIAPAENLGAMILINVIDMPYKIDDLTNDTYFLNRIYANTDNNKQLSESVSITGRIKTKELSRIIDIKRKPQVLYARQRYFGGFFCKMSSISYNLKNEKEYSTIQFTLKRVDYIAHD